MKVNVYLVLFQGELEIVTGNKQEALDLVQRVGFYQRHAAEYGWKPEDYVSTYEIEIPEEVV